MGKLLRKPAVAGSFYPADPKELRHLVQSLLSQAKSAEGIPKAIIAPHAGYVYSGPIAASAYKPFDSAKPQIKRVVLLGPSHRVPFEGLAIPEADAFETPLGNVPISKEAISKICTLKQVRVFDRA